MQEITRTCHRVLVNFTPVIDKNTQIRTDLWSMEQ